MKSSLFEPRNWCSLSALPVASCVISVPTRHAGVSNCSDTACRYNWLFWHCVQAWECRTGAYNRQRNSSGTRRSCCSLMRARPWCLECCTTRCCRYCQCTRTLVLLWVHWSLMVLIGAVSFLLPLSCGNELLFSTVMFLYKWTDD